MLLITLGLFKIRRTDPDWDPPFRCPWPIMVLFILGDLFLLAAPLIKPHTYSSSIPYYLSSVVSLGIIFLGVPYYLLRFVVVPRIFGYTLWPQQRALPDGSAITRYKWVKSD